MVHVVHGPWSISVGKKMELLIYERNMHEIAAFIKMVGIIHRYIINIRNIRNMIHNSSYHCFILGAFEHRERTRTAHAYM